jgi:patatin-like phospholipase/acyl hydrolase
MMDSGSQPSANAKRLVRVLSIDGGGVKGIIPAMILAFMERTTGTPIANLFDVIAGTSTGGLLALMLTCPQEDGKPRYSASDAADFYIQQSPRIFPPSWRIVHNVLDFCLIGKVLRFGARYDGLALRSILNELLGTMRLSDSLTRIIIPTFDTELFAQYTFDSGSARQSDEHNFLMADVGCATTAAPTFLPIARVRNISGARDFHFVDGGTTANNPARVGLNVAGLNPADTSVIVVSLGCGDATALNALGYRQAKSLTPAGWAPKFIKFTTDGNSKEVHRQLMVEMPTRIENRGCRRYFRFQVKLHRGLEELDNAGAKNLRTLRLLAESLIEEERDTLEFLGKRLLQTN